MAYQYGVYESTPTGNKNIFGDSVPNDPGMGKITVKGPTKWYDDYGNPVPLSEVPSGRILGSARSGFTVRSPSGKKYTTTPYAGRGTYMGMSTYGLQHPEWALAHPEAMGGAGVGDQPLPVNYTTGSLPQYAMPNAEDVPTYSQDYTKLPTYTAPVYDENAITTLAQQRAAPGLRALRQQINRASGVNYENPNAKRMTLRDALQGYGQGVASVINAAGQQATGEYNAKYAVCQRMRQMSSRVSHQP
jgi:hypothetical protein